jgi:hypothetical protein
VSLACLYPERRYVQRVAVVLMKLTLAPGLVAATTLASRRWGALVGGVVGGFPAVVGPILVAIYLEHGGAFAARAAAGALAGLMSLTAFVVAYGWLARRLTWAPALGLSWAAFAAATVALDGVSVEVEIALPLVLACFALAYAALPRSGDAETRQAAPEWDLPVRVLATAAFVLALTAGAGALGPRLSGLLAAFPVLASVLSAFTHAQEGAGAVAEFLRGLVAGLAGFAAFCFTVAVLLTNAGALVAFAAATAVALVVNGTLAVRARR